MTEEFHHDRKLAAKHDAEALAEAYAVIREAAVDEMVAALVAGQDVTYGQRIVNVRNGSGSQVCPLTLDASDVRDEIDGEALRYALVDCPRAEYVCELWEQAARRVCERHVDEYLEWRTTV